MYTTKKVKADKTLELDVLAHESGRCYSKIVSLMDSVTHAKGQKEERVLAIARCCPKCGNRKKPTNRNYHCNHCGFEYHRDGVGAINIWNKVSGFILNPVVGVMASPIGVRFHPHLCKFG